MNENTLRIFFKLMRRFVTSSALAACLLPTIANAFVQITYTRPVPVVAQRPALPHSYDAVGNLLAASNAVAQNAFSGTDALGWTDSSSYEGSEYTVSHVAATVARESLITTATIGIGTAAQGGSAAARTAYKGILATQAATGGYQIGKGGTQIAGGDYEAGALNVVAGSLRVGGSIASAGAVAAATPTSKNVTTVAQDGTKITGFTKHGINRAVGDGTKRAGVKPEALLDAIKNPRKITTGIDVQGRPYSVFTGKDARVVVNPQTGHVVSVNPLSRIGAN